MTFGLPGESTKSKVRAKSGRVVPIGSSPGSPTTRVGGATATSAITSLAPNTLAHTVRPILLRVNGTGLQPGCTIWIGTGAAAKPIPTQYISRTQVQSSYFVPAPAGSITVTVRNPGQVASAGSTFTVT